MVNLSRIFGGDTYLGDGMFLWGREIGWLDDETFINSIEFAFPDVEEIARLRYQKTVKGRSNC